MGLTVTANDGALSLSLSSGHSFRNCVLDIVHRAIPSDAEVLTGVLGRRTAHTEHQHHEGADRDKCRIGLRQRERSERTDGRKSAAASAGARGGDGHRR
jgi:hypothetical protein